ncbi:MAG: hypothetical protein KJZ80_16515 [Hyphomicrobiaceae bacterium]|nr:hypothetical protein [Hyphomicrobiaceae bacterium]
MRITAICRRMPSLAVALAAALFLPACTVEAGDEAAHAIAEKFAADSTPPQPAAKEARPASQPQPSETAGPRVTEDKTKETAAKRLAAEKADAERRAKAQRQADEAEMLARARAEAEERRLAKLKKLEEIEQAEAEAERLRAVKAAETERRRAEAEEQRRAAEAKRLAETAAREEARREVVRRFAEEQQRAAEAEEQRRAAEARRIAALRQLEEEGRRRAEQVRAIGELAAVEQAHVTDPSHQEIEREREAQLLSDKLRHIRESRAERDRAYPSPQGLGGPWPADPVENDGAISSTRVTVLLVMQAGSRGIRRFEKSGDPILCTASRCYVSRGGAAPAEAISRGKAFGPGVALGSRAGRCSRSLTCVFRNVDLERALAEVQPIDLRILRHDRREPRTVMADPTCRVNAGRLTCRRPVIAADYMLWVVPERTAERAGAIALETAVRAGLPGEGMALTVGN